MSDTSNTELEQARTIARQLADRMKNDPSFKAQVQKDPDSTLVKAGLPNQYVGDFIRDTGLTDVQGYQKPDTQLCFGSCILWSS